MDRRPQGEGQSYIIIGTHERLKIRGERGQILGRSLTRASAFRGKLWGKGSKWSNYGKKNQEPMMNFFKTPKNTPIFFLFVKN